MMKIFTKSWFKAACVAVLGLVSVNASAQDAHIALPESKAYGEWTDDASSVHIYAYCSGYNGYLNPCSTAHYITVTAPEGSSFSKLVLSGIYKWSGNYANFVGDSGETAVDYSDVYPSVVWTGSSSEVTFSITGTCDLELRGGLDVWFEDVVDPSLTFSVNLSSVSNGSISATPTADVHYNDVVTLTATPDAGYVLDAWTVTNNTTSAIVPVVDNQFKMPASDVTVSATFAKVYSISFNSTEHGTISASKTSGVKASEVVTLISTPESGYKLSAWSVTNDETSATIAVVNNQFTMPDANVTVSATFEENNEVIIEDAATTQSQDGVTISGGYIWYGAYWVGECLTVNAPAGTSFIRIEITDAGGWMSTNIASDCGDMTNSYGSHTWVGKSSQVLFTPPSSGNSWAPRTIHCWVEKDAPTSEDITVTAAGYTTYYNSAKAYTLPAGLTGYVVTPALQLAAEYEAGDVVPAGEPLVLQGAAGDYELVYAESSEWPLKSSLENLLEGTDAEETTPVSIYAFYNGGSDAANCYFFGLSLNAASDLNSVGFYYMNATGAAFTNGAHKAYLCLPKTMLDGVAAGQFRGFSFEEMENGLTTGISNINATEEAASFNLSGVRVAGDAKGLILRGNKKVYNK